MPEAGNGTRSQDPIQTPHATPITFRCETDARFNLASRANMKSG